MHPMKLRRLTVKETADLTPSFRRVVFTGNELVDFVTLAPADHVKLFFPDESGQIVTPSFGPDGPRKPPAGTVIARDYTPAHFDLENRELAIDFFLHEERGPASSWAASANPGDEIVVAGPRGSHLPPQEISTAVLIADETALPSVARWLQSFPKEQRVIILGSIEEPSTSGYLTQLPSTPLPAYEASWFTGKDREDALVASLSEITLDAKTFVYVAGEAGLVVRARRFLRQELGLTKEQVDAHGYWKRGVANHDHHEPLEPSESR